MMKYRHRTITGCRYVEELIATDLQLAKNHKADAINMIKTIRSITTAKRLLEYNKIIFNCCSSKEVMTIDEIAHDTYSDKYFSTKNFWYKILQNSKRRIIKLSLIKKYKGIYHF